ncbi:MAG TPA: heavy metal translocating P-type ATPase [Casimicrobiaceae bacterium]|nr:heavy metal translocating P-type ATPase [Casimicrobiaceae bacterium]
MLDSSSTVLASNSPSLSSRRAARVEQACFHCGSVNPPGTHWSAVLDGADRQFCCAGCLAIAQTIRAAGLTGFYVRRTAPASPPSSAEDWLGYDAAGETAGWIVRVDADLRETSLLLEGIQCAACAWLNEEYLKRQAGVVAVSVNLATRRAYVRWDSRVTRLSVLLRAIAAIGYCAFPYDPERREALAKREGRALLTRTAVALLAMMQVMMFAVPAYLSADGVEPQFQALLAWASLVLTLPVVLYSAAPFFRGVLRDLRLRRMGMDIPIALGVGGAFAASAWATITANGAVYYDSVTMFVALLLCGRYIELRARQKAGEALERVAPELPATAERLTGYPRELTADVVAAVALQAGDVVRVASGAVVPADGEVIDGRSSVEESILTGESWPRAKAPGDSVLAGSINRDSPLIVRVRMAGPATALAQIARLAERAANERPRLAQLADRAAAWFVAALLLIALATAIGWWITDPTRALAATFAVLVVSCPCALSLATPAALAAAVGALGRSRVLVVRGHALEALAGVRHVVFDKTGTLTTGEIQLIGVVALGQHDRDACIALASALEQGSTHPIARVLSGGRPSTAADAVTAVPGSGVEGLIDGRRYRFGRPQWVQGLHGRALPEVQDVAAAVTPVALADESGWLGWFSFGDALRPGVRALVDALSGRGLAVSLLSGDRATTAASIARSAGITRVQGDARPEDKRAFIAGLQRAGVRVAMVGDGVNDAAALAQADVSLSFGSATDLARWTSDIVLLGDDIGRLADALAIARRTRRVIVQNIAWALAYNSVAIPLAVAGALTPLAAALGMSASSLLVVANALRLGRGTASAPERSSDFVTSPLGSGGATS